MTTLTNDSQLREQDLSVLKPTNQRFTLERYCPNCLNAYALERVHRPFWVKRLLFFIPTRAYTCHLCDHTFIKVGKR